MGGSGDWTIDYGNSGEIAGKTLEGLAPHEIEGIVYSTPAMLRNLIEAAKEAENPALIGIVGAFAYHGAIMSAREQSLVEQGTFTSHNLYQPHEFLDVAALAFPQLEDEAERARSASRASKDRAKSTSVFKRLGDWATRQFQPLTP